MRRAILVLTLTLTACGATASQATIAPKPATAAPATDLESQTDQDSTDSSPDSSTDPDSTLNINGEARRPMVVPLTLHVVVEKDEPTSELSSQRTVDEVAEIAQNMQGVWDQADVVFDPIHVNLLEIPTSVLFGVSVGDTGPFFDQVNSTFVPENAQALNGFYVRSAFGVNGFAPTGSAVFFVVDEPSVNDERVSSHEIGHIFGLHHDLQDRTQLMFSGTNGTGLSAIEQTVSRYGIQRIFPQDVAP